MQSARDCSRTRSSVVVTTISSRSLVSKSNVRRYRNSVGRLFPSNSQTHSSRVRDRPPTTPLDGSPKATPISRYSISSLGVS